MDTPIRNFVFPLISAEPQGDDVAIRKVLGTAFLLGANRGLALTARHVVDGPVQGHLGASFVDAESHWRVWGVEVVARHRVEDIALLRLHPEAPIPDSPFTLETPEVFSSAGYSVWGYPSEVFYELGRNGVTPVRPDLVYSEGHVRRRLTGVDVMNIHGSALLELSTAAGAGFSGSPVTLRSPHGGPWGVIGVYLGERETEKPRSSIGYAARVNAARDLVRECLGSDASI